MFNKTYIICQKLQKVSERNHRAPRQMDIMYSWTRKGNIIKIQFSSN